HRLVSERPGSRDHANVARLMDIPWHDANFAFTRRDHTRAVGSNQPAAGPAHIAADLYHVEHRHALGDADDQLDASRDRFQNRVGCKRGRHIDDGRVSSGRFARLLHRVENRNSFEVRPALSWYYSTHHLGAVFLASARMNLAGG